jgi:ATP-binding protein involved in chromosome partitioning
VKRYKDIAGDGGSNIVGQVQEQQTRLQRRLRDVRHIVAVVSGKGGVGKSSLSGALACCWALEGWRVGVLDADLNGPSMAKILGVRGAQLVTSNGAVIPPRTPLGIKVMSMDLLLPSDAAPLTWAAPTPQESHTWRGTTEANALREFLADTDWGRLDVLVLDLPPGTDRISTAIGLVPKLAGTVIVTIPSDVSQLVVRRSITAVRQARAPIVGLVENMAGLFPGPAAEAMAVEAGVPFLGCVPFDRALADAADRGAVFVATSSESPAARALVEIAQRIREDLESRAAAARDSRSGGPVGGNGERRSGA